MASLIDLEFTRLLQGLPYMENVQSVACLDSNYEVDKRCFKAFRSFMAATVRLGTIAAGQAVGIVVGVVGVALGLEEDCSLNSFKAI